jgi:PadR family transcriptional regulator, regulatory protein PadR
MYFITRLRKRSSASASLRNSAGHGYQLGPGTMYPLLHSMERRGWLKARINRVENRNRKCYTATRAGKAALQEAIGRVRELFLEITEN